METLIKCTKGYSASKGRGMIVVAAFSCAGVSNDKVVLDSHIFAKQNCLDFVPINLK